MNIQIELNGDFNESQPANGEIDNLSNGILEVSLEKSTTGNNADPPQSMMMNQPIIPAEEPESIKRWREQHVKNLELKDQEEKEKIEELRKQAKKELEEWYKRYHEEVEKTKKQNRYVLFFCHRYSFLKQIMFSTNFVICL